MTWTYSQARGIIQCNGTLEGTGYSGFGIGLNNGALEAEHDLGPIPRGEYLIVEWFDHYEDKGPTVARLEPIGHNAHGRTGFLVHGDNEQMNHTASHGCIIAPRGLRTNWRASKDMDLEVVA